jgi:hypothetical protein
MPGLLELCFGTNQERHWRHRTCRAEEVIVAATAPLSSIPAFVCVCLCLCVCFCVCVSVWACVHVSVGSWVLGCTCGGCSHARTHAHKHARTLTGKQARADPQKHTFLHAYRKDSLTPHAFQLDLESSPKIALQRRMLEPSVNCCPRCRQCNSPCKLAQPYILTPLQSM